MKRAVTSLAVLALWAGVGVNFAAAQFGTLGQPPRFYYQYQNPPAAGAQPGTLSTYGILRQPYDPNRPDAAAVLQRMSAEGTLQQLLANQAAAQAPLQTGHSVTFLDTQGYFPGGVPTGSSGTTGATPSLGGPGGFFSPGMLFGSFYQGPAGLYGTSGIGGFPFVR